MRIHWKALLGYGFIFWLILCLSDLLGFTQIHNYSHFDELYSQPFEQNWLNNHQVFENQKQGYRGLRFGWALVVLNSLTFIFSIIICSFLRALTWAIYKMVFSRRLPTYEVKRVSSIERNSNTSLSKIPIMVKSPSAIIRSSDTDLSVKDNITSEKSCPNLLAIRRSGSNLSTRTASHCETLFKNEKIFSANLCGNGNQDLEAQCKKLQGEVLKVHSNSLKEHALLSRKLDSVIKEKKDINRQLAIAQKENRAAKQQLEELLQEKSILVKRLETATREFKCNTKTKKYALAKLEEVTGNVEQLRLQLEQVSRDKEILQKKLKLLENEYNKLHERYLNVQNQQGATPEVTPERDDEVTSGDKEHAVDSAKEGGAGNANVDFTSNSIPNNATNLIASVSQTELDMKKIQMKIKQLEKNLENFSVNTTTYKSGDETEMSMSAGCHTDGSSTRLAEDGLEYQSDVIYSDGNNSPKPTFWTNKSAEIFGKHEQYAKIQALATKMHEKVRYLGKIKERSEDTADDESTDIEDISSASDIREPTRIVSSSLAFKNFLKGLNQTETARRSINVLGEYYF